MALFFRDPDRRCDATPPTADDVLSPADGVVMVAGEPQPGVAPEGDWQQVSVFLSVVDVHVNRSPYRGEVVESSYRKGSFLAAYRKESAHRNERSELWLRDGRAHRRLPADRRRARPADRDPHRHGPAAGDRRADGPDEVRLPDGRLPAAGVHDHRHARASGCAAARPSSPAGPRPAEEGRSDASRPGAPTTVEFVRGSVRGTRRRALATLPSLFTLGNMMLRLRRDPGLDPRRVPAGRRPHRAVRHLRHHRRRGRPAGRRGHAVRPAVRLPRRPGLLRAGAGAAGLHAVLRGPRPVGPARLDRLLPLGGLRGDPAGPVQHHDRPHGRQAVLHRHAQPGRRRASSSPRSSPSATRCRAATGCGCCWSSSSRRCSWSATSGSARSGRWSARRAGGRTG